MNRKERLLKNILKKGRYLDMQISLFLFCNDTIREKLLKERGWSDDLIREHKDFNSWILNNANQVFRPKMPLIDTSNKLPKEVAMEVKQYIETILMNR